MIQDHGYFMLFHYKLFKFGLKHWLRLGAAFVTLLEEPKERRERSSPSPQRCQRAREELREDQENCIKRRRIGDEDGEEVGEDEHEYPENGAFYNGGSPEPR